MATSKQLLDLTYYPDSDGEPMTESDPTRDYLIYCVEALNLFFQSRRNVYVSGNLFIYYKQGDTKAVVSPDVFVVFGVSKRKRRSYKVWQEDNQVPAFVLEVTSASTKDRDEREKPQIYAQLGVQEYFQYDPTGDYLQPQLKGFQLVDGQYHPLPTAQLADGLVSIRSQVLGLDLRLQEPVAPVPIAVDGAVVIPKELRFYDPQTGEKLLSYVESEQARQQAEQARIEAEQARIEVEQARQQAEQARIEAEQARLAEVKAREQVEQARLTAIPRLLAIGLTVEQVADALNVSVQEVREFTEG